MWIVRKSPSDTPRWQTCHISSPAPNRSAGADPMTAAGAIAPVILPSRADRTAAPDGVAPLADHGPDRTMADSPGPRATGGSGSPSASGPESGTPT